MNCLIASYVKNSMNEHRCGSLREYSDKIQFRAGREIFDLTLRNQNVVDYHSE